MGIKDLLKLINDECPDVVNQVHMNELYGESIAVDISIFAYKYLLSLGDNTDEFISNPNCNLKPEGGPWLNPLALFICKLKKFGIKAIFIFDGSSQPEEKKATQISRVNSSSNSIIRRDRCHEILMGLSSGSIELTPEIQKECKEITQLRNRFTNYSDIDDVKETLRIKISRLSKSCLRVTSDHKKLLRRMVRAFGFPEFEAIGEAETVCAQFAISGIVSGVLSEDTDVLAYGANMLSFGSNLTLSDNKLRIINYQNLIDSLDMNEYEFRDLCILLRCDYNVNKFIDGVSTSVSIKLKPSSTGKKSVAIGYKKALPLIREYNSLDDMEDIIENFEDLNHNRCRKLLSVITTEQVISIGAIGDLNFNELQQLEAYGLTCQKYIEEVWEPVKPDN